MIERSGCGLFSGAPARVVLRRCDGPLRLRVLGERAALHECSVHTMQHATALRLPSGAWLRSVEHLAAALAGLSLHQGIEIELVQGDELPLLDGAAAEWARALAALGAQPSAARAHVARPFAVDIDGSRYAFAPAAGVHVRCQLRTEHPMLVTEAQWDGSAAQFVAQLAPARTFVFERDLLDYRRRGVQVAIAPEQLVLVRDEGVQSAGRAATLDEPVRHKLLDLIGDLFVHGGLQSGRVEVSAPGHARTHSAVAQAKRAGAWLCALSALLLAAPPAQAAPPTQATPRATYDAQLEKYFPNTQKRWRRPIAARTPWQDSGTGARLTMPELATRRVRLQLQNAFGVLFGEPDAGLSSQSLVQRSSVTIDVPVRGQSVHLGMRYSWAVAQAPRRERDAALWQDDASSALLSGNNEVWARVHWTHASGLSVGGALELVLPLTAGVRQSGTGDRAAAARALSIGNWLSFWGRAFGVRPALDVRLQHKGFQLQLRQALSFAIGLDGGADSADTIVAEGSLYLGQRVGKMQLGVEFAELYFLDRLGNAGDTRRDAARPRYSFAPQLALDCGLLRPHLAVFYSPVSSYDGASLLGAQLTLQLAF